MCQDGTVAEDWRVTVTLEEGDHTGRLLGVLHEHEVEDDVRQKLGDRVAVSGSGNHVFLYGDTEQATQAAQEVVEGVLQAHGMRGVFRLDRWHHEEEEWEDASKSMPATTEEHKAEHARLEQQETDDSQASGIAEWEVRIELRSHHDARALAQRLQDEGSQVVRRWTFLLIGTNDEDDAHALAERLQAEMPDGATIHVEPAGGLAWQLMPRSPFAVFGGLAS